MRKLITILTPILFTATSALAGNLDGLWKGEVNYTTSDGYSETYLCQMTITIVPDQTVTIDDPNACTYTPYVSTVMTIQGEDLYLDGDLYGSLKGDHIALTETYSSGGVWTLDLLVNGKGELELKDAYADPDGYNDLTTGTLVH